MKLKSYAIILCLIFNITINATEINDSSAGPILSQECYAKISKKRAAAVKILTTPRTFKSVSLIELQKSFKHELLEYLVDTSCGLNRLKALLGGNRNDAIWVNSYLNNRIFRNSLWDARNISDEELVGLSLNMILKYESKKLEKEKYPLYPTDRQFLGRILKYEEYKIYKEFEPFFNEASEPKTSNNTLCLLLISYFNAKFKLYGEYLDLVNRCIGPKIKSKL